MTDKAGPRVQEVGPIRMVLDDHQVKPQLTVRTWRGRFAVKGMKGLADLPRSGRPPVFATTVVAHVKALACSLPAEHGQPLSRWSAQDLAKEAVTQRITSTLSASTVQRWLHVDAIKP